MSQSEKESAMAGQQVDIALNKKLTINFKCEVLQIINRMGLLQEIAEYDIL